MYHYDYFIAGLLLRVNSPFALREQPELSDFEIEYSPAAVPDAVYTLQQLPDDWKIEGTKLYEDRQNAFYEYSGEVHRYYFWNVFSKDYYVLLRHKKDDLRNFFLCLPTSQVERIVPQFRLSAFLSMERLALHHQGFFLHASVIDWQGKGILFTAPSGVGKSTQANLWHQLEGAQILNGDRALIRYRQGTFSAHGSPYAGTSGVFLNKAVEISAIVVLSQGTQNRISQLPSTEAFQKLLHESSAHYWDQEFINGISELLLSLIARVPVFHLSCLPDAGAVAILKGKLS